MNNSINEHIDCAQPNTIGSHIFLSSGRDLKPYSLGGCVTSIKGKSVFYAKPKRLLLTDARIEHIKNAYPDARFLNIFSVQQSGLLPLVDFSEVSEADIDDFDENKFSVQLSKCLFSVKDPAMAVAMEIFAKFVLNRSLDYVSYINNLKPTKSGSFSFDPNQPFGYSNLDAVSYLSNLKDVAQDLVELTKAIHLLNKSNPKLFPIRIYD